MAVGISSGRGNEKSSRWEGRFGGGENGLANLNGLGGEAWGSMINSKVAGKRSPLPRGRLSCQLSNSFTPNVNCFLGTALWICFVRSNCGFFGRGEKFARVFGWIRCRFESCLAYFICF